MKLSLNRAMTIARREFLTTIRRRAFLFTLVFVPAYYALVTIVPGMLIGKSVAKRLAATHVIAVVDSSGALVNAPDEIVTQLNSDRGGPFAKRTGADALPSRFRSKVEFLPDQASGEAALRDGHASLLLVVPPDYLATGRLRRYTKENSFIGGNSRDRSLRGWLARALVVGTPDTVRAARAADPMPGMQDFSLNRSDEWVLKDDAREAVDLFLPIGVALLLGMSIVIGGQYLLQGIAEEKESRILESLLSTVSPDDLMIGKLIGLGSAGMTLVAVWTFAGLTFGGPIAALIGARISPFMMVCGVLYFAFGYLFYASLMTVIGAITNNLREAQQIAYMFTIANFAPMFVWISIVDQPNGAIPTVMSMIPFTAASTMLMRLGTGAAVPLWHIGLSLGILIASALLAIRIGSRIFRTGLLMYGKTPNLPEILRWARQS